MIIKQTRDIGLAVRMTPGVSGGSKGRLAVSASGGIGVAVQMLKKVVSEAQCFLFHFDETASTGFVDCSANCWESVPSVTGTRVLSVDETDLTTSNWFVDQPPDLSFGTCECDDAGTTEATTTVSNSIGQTVTNFTVGNKLKATVDISGVAGKIVGVRIRDNFNNNETSVLVLPDSDCHHIETEYLTVVPGTTLIYIFALILTFPSVVCIGRARIEEIPAIAASTVIDIGRIYNGFGEININDLKITEAIAGTPSHATLIIYTSADGVAWDIKDEVVLPTGMKILPQTFLINGRYVKFEVTAVAGDPVSWRMAGSPVGGLCLR